MKLLFIDACIRPSQISRTYQLCNTYIDSMNKKIKHLDVMHLDLKNEEINSLSYPDLQLRDSLIETSKWDHPMFKYANEMLKADYILFGAPYWDLSFPSILKNYLERIIVSGLIFNYTEKNIETYTKIRHVAYITTSGGFIAAEGNYGADYVAALCRTFLGVSNFQCFSAQGLDIVGANVDNIMRLAEDHIQKSVLQGDMFI